MSKDHTGQRFGRLLVLHSMQDKIKWDGSWMVRCDCGVEKELKNSLLMGGTKSCGCLNNDMFAKIRDQTTHGATSGPKASREYAAWAGMKSRCFWKEGKAYPRYGGRGITVWPGWIDDFPAFLAHVGPRPSRRHSLGRIDNDGNYEPGNVRWETGPQQHNNKCSNHLIVFNGEEKTMQQWSEQMDIPKAVLAYRMSAGWGAERALTTPCKPRRNRGAKWTEAQIAARPKKPSD